MKITYLGTAAAEAIPALFCQCPACESARKNLGKELRGRSGCVIDDTLMIDCPPDVYHTTIRVGVYLPGITHLVFTHSHDDHCCTNELRQRLMPTTCKRINENDPPMQVYGNEAVLNKLESLDGKEDKGLKLNYLPPFTPTKLGDVTVTALRSDHKIDEKSYFYMIERDGKRFIYGHDTGIFPAESLEYLKGKRADVVSLDCTYVVGQSERSHMGIDANIKLKRMLIEQGTADENTRFIANHFSHNGFMMGGKQTTLAEFEAYCAANGFDVSYDGMTFEI